MVFSLFSRKPVPAPRDPTPDPSPLPASSPPPVSPSPSTSPLPPTDIAPLRSLLASVPANLLYTYTLASLAPDARPLSQNTLAALTDFFSALSPPPRLHCVRCHKPFFDVENSDHSCVVPHDDDSAEVERVGWARASSAEYQTLWACCGRTVEGAGDMGPPDGWCYEGKHTTDVKRARFRADSTLYDDKLVSCDRLDCFGLQRPSTSPGAERSNVNHPPRGRKRAYTVRDEPQNTDGEDSIAGRAVSSSPRRKTSLPHVLLTKRSPSRAVIKPKSNSAKSDTRPAKPRSRSGKLRSTSPQSCPKSTAPISMASATSSLTEPPSVDGGETDLKPAAVAKQGNRKRRKVV